MSPADLKAYLHQHIPLSADLAVRVAELDGDKVTLSAELTPNLNHRATAFGGSISALAILVGWCYVHLRLQREGHPAHTVRQESSVRYRRPVEGDFAAKCDVVEEAEWARCSATVTRRGKGRIRLGVTVESAGTVVATFEGAYVASVT